MKMQFTPKTNYYQITSKFRLNGIYNQDKLQENSSYVRDDGMRKINNFRLSKIKHVTK